MQSTTYVTRDSNYLVVFIALVHRAISSHVILRPQRELNI